MNNPILQSNFLSTERVKAIRNLFIAREATLVGTLVLVCGVVTAAVLGSLWLVTWWRVQDTRASVTTQQQLLSAIEHSVSSQTTAQYKQELQTLLTHTEAPLRLYTLLDYLSQSRQHTSGISISALNLTTEEKSTLSVSGQADTRAHFLEFVEALQAIPDIAGVTYPPSIVFGEEPLSFELAVHL